MAEGKTSFRTICTAAIFVIINVLFLLLGAAVIAGGSYLVATGNSLQLFAALGPIGLAAIVIIVGIVIFLVAAVGILGGCLRNRVILGIYLIAMLIIVLVEVGAAIGAIVKRGALVGAVNDTGEQLFDRFALNGTDADFVNSIQTLFMCCGWNNYTDYTSKDVAIPGSCNCSTSPPVCINVTNDHHVFKRGCQEGVQSILQTYLAAIIAVAIVIAILEVLVMILGCGLCICVAKDKNGYEVV